MKGADEMTYEETLADKAEAMLETAENRATAQRVWLENPPTPDVPARVSASQKSLANTSIMRLASLAADAGTARTRYIGAVATSEDPAEAEKWTNELDLFERDTSFSQTANEAIWNAAVDGCSALVVGTGLNGDTFIMSERLGRIGFKRSTAAPAWKPTVAVKKLSEKKLIMWDGEKEVTFERSDTGPWTESKSEDFDGMPVTILYARRDGRGVFEGSHDSMKRVNTAIYQLTAVAQTHAAKLRALKQEKGTEGTYSPENQGELQTSMEGGFLELPPGIEIWEGKDGQLNELIAHVRAQVAMWCSETGTPIPTMFTDSVNASAEGAKQSESAVVQRAVVAQEMARDGIRMALVKAMRLKGMPDSVSISVMFAPAKEESMLTRMQQFQLAVSAGMPIEFAAEHVAGFSKEETRKLVAQMKETSEEVAPEAVVE